jgi:3-oxoacyl-[acyl-carrier-protein] synthase II
MTPSGEEASCRIVVTGVGAVTPLGRSVDRIAERLFSGHGGIRRVDNPLFPAGRPIFAAVIDDGAGDVSEPRPVFEAPGRADDLCRSAIVAALADAGFETGPAAWPTGPRIGLVAGIGAERLKAWEVDFLRGGCDVFTGPTGESLAHRAARAAGISGPVATVGSACASSGHALAVARGWLEAGWVDACIAGGCEILTPAAVAAFHNLRALSRRADDPARASRPFDRDRDGFVIGEGAVFLVLERSGERAAARPQAALTGVGVSSDAHHMVAPAEDGLHAAAAISRALDDAGIGPGDVDYLNAHAAGTPVGDIAEARAIRLAFGDRADTLPVSSTKGLSGHMVSAAAAFEAVACIAAIQRSQAPATANLDHPDDRCPLDHVRGAPRPLPIRTVVSNSFGFGGANISLVIEAV